MKDGQQLYKAPSHFASYGLIGGQHNLTQEYITSLYEAAITVGHRCCKKHGYLYIKFQNQVKINTSYQLSKYIEHKFSDKLIYIRIQSILS